MGRTLGPAGLTPSIVLELSLEAHTFPLTRRLRLVCQCSLREHVSVRQIDSERQCFCRIIFNLGRDRLREGKSVALHCRQGVGRSALLAACVLAVLGVAQEDGWQRITAARKSPVPDTEEQRSWVAALAQEMTA